MALHSNRDVSRRSVLRWPAAALLPGVVLPQQDSAVSRLREPELAGRARSRTTDYENDPFIIGVEQRLRCTCGCNLDVYTCRTTDFTCTVSPAMHRQVVGLVEQGKTADEILQAFIAEHGEMVLMAPPKEGFNLVGYVVPGMAITAVGALMLWMLSRRSRVASTASSGDASASWPTLSEEDAAKLEAELADLER